MKPRGGEGVRGAARRPIRRVAFIGLGAMGLPMAKNLVKAGVAVTGYDPRPGPAAALLG